MAKQNPEENHNGIDNLNEHLTDAGRKIAENRRILYWAVGLIVAAGLLVGSYFIFFKTPQENKSFDAYNNVEINYAGNDTLQAKEYAKVADKFSGDAGNLAALESAEHYYNIGDYKQAIKYLDKFSTSENVLGANALVLKGDCFVNLKKYAEAIDAYNKAIKESDDNPVIIPRCLMKMATVYLAQNKHAEALKAYEQVAENYPDFVYNNLPIASYVEREKAVLGK